MYTDMIFNGKLSLKKFPRYHPKGIKILLISFKGHLILSRSQSFFDLVKQVSTKE